MNDINSCNISTLEKLMTGADKVALVTHMKTDGDAMGSSIALYHYLRSIGKPSRIIINDPYPTYLSFLVREEMSGDILVYDSNPSESAEYITSSDLVICLDFNAFHRTDRLETPLSEARGKKILIDHHLNPARELLDLLQPQTAEETSVLIPHALICHRLF